MTKVLKILIRDEVYKFAYRSFAIVLVVGFFFPILLLILAKITYYLMVAKVSIFIQNKDSIINGFLYTNKVVGAFILIGSKYWLYVFVGILFLKLFATVLMRRKITDIMEAIEKEIPIDTELENGSIIKKGTAYKELHFGNFKNMFKYKKTFKSLRDRLNWLRYKEIEGFLEIIKNIESKKEGYESEHIVFKASSHLLTEKSIRRVGGIQPKAPEKMPIFIKVGSYITIFLQILLNTPLKFLKETWDNGMLSPQNTVNKALTVYIYSEDLLKKKGEIEKRIEKYRGKYF